MSEPYKIYTLHDPDTMAVRYVGFTSKTLEKRLNGHIYAARFMLSDTSHRMNWIRSILNSDKIPVIKLVEIVSEGIWQERERFWISHFRSIGCDLTNSCDGGIGTINPSKETREKMSAANRGRILSDKTREKISAAGRGRVHSHETKEKMTAAWRRNKRAQEHLQRLSSANIGRKRSRQTREKIGNASRGRKHTMETKLKMSAAHLGISHTKAARDKISNSLRGRKQSAEHLEKLSIIRRGKKLSPERREVLMKSVRKPVIEISTGRFFGSLTEASLALGIPTQTLSYRIKTGKFVYAGKHSHNQLKGAIAP